MPSSLRTLCEQALEFMTSHKLLPDYVPTGRYVPAESRLNPLVRPEERLAIWYSPLEGDLYLREEDWRVAFQLVRSFTKRGGEGSRFRMPALWGEVPLELGEMAGQLPSAMALLGFECVTWTPVARMGLFRRSESCRIEQLPEPYGKWLQHQRKAPRWDKPADMQVDILCRLTALDARRCSVDLEFSTFAIGTAVQLGKTLTELLSVSPPLRFTYEYLKTKAQLELAGGKVDLMRIR